MKWAIGALLLLAVGLVFQLGLLVYAMYVLLGVLVMSRSLTKQCVESITATRECSRTTAEIGDQVGLSVTVQNRAWLPVVWVLLEDSLPHSAIQSKPPRIKLHGHRHAIMHLRPRKKQTLLYQVTFEMRGFYQIGPLLLESGDLFGLHRRYKIISEPHLILVYPKVIPLDGYDLASRRPIGEVKLSHRLFEDPTRISGVRQYQIGDPLNRIHWKATARTGELHSKTYEPSSIAGISLLLDFHQRSYNKRGEPHRSELAVTTAASLANAVYLLGQQIGLYTNGRDAADRIRLEGYKEEFQSREVAQQTLAVEKESDRLQPLKVETQRGPEQLQQIFETLARVELTDGLTFAELIIEVASRLPRDATVAAILPSAPIETAFALGTLRRSGFAVTAILVMFSDELDYPEHAGRLMAEGIEVRQVEDELELANLCSQQLVR